MTATHISSCIHTSTTYTLRSFSPLLHLHLKAIWSHRPCTLHYSQPRDVCTRASHAPCRGTSLIRKRTTPWDTPRILCIGQRQCPRGGAFSAKRGIPVRWCISLLHVEVKAIWSHGPSPLEYSQPRDVCKRALHVPYRVTLLTRNSPPPLGPP